MKDKNVIFSLCLILVVLGIVISRIQYEPRAKEAFDRHPSSLRYAPQALCIMDCKGISNEEINEVMKKGIIHFSKSNRNERPCPRFVLQGHTSSKKSLQVVFIQCLGETKVTEVLYKRQSLRCPCSE